jgi:hypothetical protein
VAEGIDVCRVSVQILVENPRRGRVEKSATLVRQFVDLRLKIKGANSEYMFFLFNANVKKQKTMEIEKRILKTPQWHRNYRIPKKNS